MTDKQTGGSLLLSLVRDIARHFVNQNCPRMATALSYQTLLAIVPLAALSLALFTYLDAFYQIQIDLFYLLLDNFLPSTISHIQSILQDLVLNSRKLTYFGVAGLVITAMLLLSSIESVFTKIWQVDVTRNIFKRFIAYLLITLLGPVAIGTSLTLARWIASLTREFSGMDLSAYTPYFNFSIPFAGCFLILFLIYRLVPARRVKWRHAALGAAVAAALFILGKYAFKLYLELFPTYQVIYGALAALPIFLIWLYLSWVMVLLGATITAVLGFRFTGKMKTRDDAIAVEDLPKARD
ncbi:YihY family inner membrane protein [Sneathiella chinensis]|uniref:UPF0761 membrane protein n=1 Tax=Sneathiella chinensis TaxID=349750 RepID=A0ABQ5U2C9_9PROT|nr:YihY family inner membrane protein [Sneathiella chinensis]GLQ05335.1 UPF0761 membrane protein [Sneathiella chinensis]